MCVYVWRIQKKTVKEENGGSFLIYLVNKNIGDKI